MIQIEVGPELEQVAQPSDWSTLIERQIMLNLGGAVSELHGAHLRLDKVQPTQGTADQYFCEFSFKGGRLGAFDIHSHRASGLLAVQDVLQRVRRFVQRTHRFPARQLASREQGAGTPGW